MNEENPRIAFFPDAYNEVDGVAMVAHHFRDYAENHGLPFLLFHAGDSDECVREGSVTRAQLKRSQLSFPLDRAHDFDLAFMRHYGRVAAMLHEFQPDYIQITGPSDVGILGMTLARKLKIPLAAFWQTNLPQYAGLRMRRSLSLLPQKMAVSAGRAAEGLSAVVTNSYYRVPELLFAPNVEIAAELAKATGKPCSLMRHGVDLQLFDPAKRERTSEAFTIGYVGRLSSEKNVRMLAEIERALLARGCREFRFLIVGQGTEGEWLRENMSHAEIAGVLRGEALARAFAGMDVLAFPSETETFGLVVLEALASGVPAVVTDRGGPQHTVRHGETGFVARNAEEFAASIETLMTQPERLAAMRVAAREDALDASWERAFEDIYRSYRDHALTAEGLQAYPLDSARPAGV